MTPVGAQSNILKNVSQKVPPSKTKPVYHQIGYQNPGEWISLMFYLGAQEDWSTWNIDQDNINDSTLFRVYFLFQVI